ncbi:solute carrier family 2, facilitated glucose transporter member 7 isoform X1 [Drosophila persimilis]|uniref:solute carrier family 2, facilitated glucose transporter member 7 isoform X1 n=1 Tax=Drosophila persimilis TaxID=7234 RepID=UPI000F092ADF|nr:solute carrier family 2, facilitated glucose transporter member 7 isoform X1 [Drosophila persimilis]
MGATDKNNDHVTPAKGRGWNTFLLFICLSVTVGTTIPVGYFIGVLNAPAELIKRWCEDILASEYDTIVSSSQLDILWTSIVSIYLIGGICGSCFSALCSDKYGRKGCLMISCAILVVCGMLFTWCRAAKSLEMLMVGRFLGGIASALIFTAQPMYLLELAPSKLSGSVGVFTCIGVTGGILLAQVVTLSQLLGNENLWPYALSFYTLLVLVSLLPMWWFPESPRWLYLHKGDSAGSELALRRIRGQGAEEEVQRELLEMKATLEAQAQASSKDSSLCQVLGDRELFLPLLLVCSFQATQQLSGINAIFFYSLSILTQAGFSPEAATWLNLGIGGFNLCTSLLGPLLVHKFPRRPLMMLSCAVCALSLLAMSIGLYFLESSGSTVLTYFCAAFILIFILGFQIGLGPIAYFIGSELLEDSPRPVAMSMGSLFSWIGNFLVGMCFPLLQRVWSSFAFMPCMCVCIYCLLLTWRYLPETRGREPKDVKPLMSHGLLSKLD